MKNFVKNTSINKTFKSAFLLAAITTIFILAGNVQVSAQKIPTAARLQAMLRETMRGFTDAVEAEDFSQLHANSSADFQATFTTAQLKEIFQVFIDKKDILLPSLRSVSTKRARFTKGPLIRTESGYKILVVDGVFATMPYKTNFQMEYEWTGNAWELLTIKVSM